MTLRPKPGGWRLSAIHPFIRLKRSMSRLAACSFQLAGLLEALETNPHTHSYLPFRPSTTCLRLVASTATPPTTIISLPFLPPSTFPSCPNRTSKTVASVVGVGQVPGTCSAALSPATRKPMHHLETTATNKSVRQGGQGVILAVPY